MPRFTFQSRVFQELLGIKIVLRGSLDIKVWFAILISFFHNLTASPFTKFKMKHTFYWRNYPQKQIDYSRKICRQKFKIKLLCSRFSWEYSFWGTPLWKVICGLVLIKIVIESCMFYFPRLGIEGYFYCISWNTTEVCPPGFNHNHLPRRSSSMSL